MASAPRIGIEPNPKRRLGGHARLVFPGVELEPGATLVIQRESDGHYMGSSGWQSGSATVQPDQVLNESGNGVMEIGPAVVDYIETYSLLRIEVPAAGIESRTTWPDDIAPSPGQAKAGAIQGAWRAPPASAPAMPAKPPVPAAPEQPVESEPVMPPRLTAEHIEEHEEEKKSSRHWVRFALLALILIGGLGSAYFLLWHEGLTPAPKPDPVVVKPLPAEPPLAVEGPGCTQETLREAFQMQDAEVSGALMALSEVCGGEENEDLRLTAMVEAAKLGHGPAALQMGRWYDPQYAEADRSPLPPQAAYAVRYYSQAEKLDVAGAREALERVCARLKESRDPVEQVAADSYCIP